MMHKSLLVLIFGVLAINTISAQEIVLAYPEKNITVDGSLSDWPESVNWYRISHYYGGNTQSNEDFSAQFAVTYNKTEQAIYLAVKVLDDDFISDNGKSHTTQDHMLLYLDTAHDIKGGTPVYYVASDRVLEVHHKPGGFDTRNQFLTLDKAQAARKYVGNTIQYEWKISLNGHLQLNKNVLGLDFMMIDHDSDGGNEAILIWKDGFGKSYGSQKMGDLILVDDKTQSGKVTGQIDFKLLDTKDRINSIDIVSSQNPNLWVKTEVDTTGYFQAFLPKGNYMLRPNRHFTSPIYSSGFSQNTRKLEYAKMPSFEIKPNLTTSLEPISLKVKPQPEVSKRKGKGLPITYLTQKDIDTFIETWRNYFEIPAISVVVIRDNKVFYDKTLGYKSKLSNEKADDQTLFEAASITKSVFATMVLKLAENGLINLDKPLYEYLSFPNIENDERSKLLTARIILGHQSGLPNWAWGGPGIWEGTGEIELGFKPGTAFGYSGEAFNYLGRVIEHITGKPLQTLYEEEIEKPFDIKSSYFYYTDAQEDRFAMGHMQHYPQIKEKERVASPASSLSTNAHLFKNYVMTMMNEKGLQKTSFDLIYTPYTILEPGQKIYDPDIPQYVSHGFFVQDTNDGKLIAHGGNNGDYDSKFAYNPDKKYAYIVFTNSNLGDEFVRAFEEFLLKYN